MRQKRTRQNHSLQVALLVRKKIFTDFFFEKIFVFNKHIATIKLDIEIYTFEVICGPVTRPSYAM